MSVRETGFYDVLGVSPGATKDQIKKAFRQIAISSHPDKVPESQKAEAETKFKAATRAYEILSNPETRDVYDKYGEEGLERGGGGGPGGMNAEDIFSQFFGGGFPFGGGGGRGGPPPGPQKAKTIVHVHRVTLEDIYRGKTSKMALQRQIICKTCKGIGGKPGSVKKCQGCNGQGAKFVTRQIGPMIQRMQVVCPDCEGQRETVDPKDKCKECSGKKTTVERTILTIHIDRGMQNGSVIVKSGEGDQYPGVEPGDVKFEIEVKPHSRFARSDNGHDLHYKTTIDLFTALAGGTINIEHLDERWLTVVIVPGETIAPSSIKCITGQGMPSERHHDLGDLYIHFEVKFPGRIGVRTEDGYQLPPEAIQTLRAIMPPEIMPTPVPANAMVEDAVLADVDHTRFSRNNRANGEDDDDEQMGGERVQCATQ